MNSLAYGLVVVLVVAAVGAYALLPIPPPGSTGTVSSTTSTTMTTCTTSSVTGSVSSATYKGTYSPGNSSGVRVDFVNAVVYTEQPGQQTLRFEVGFTDVGNSSIYILTGCGSTLSSNITSGSDVVRRISGGARCLCAEALSPLSPGENATEFEPGCWSGYYYQVVQPGAFTANLTLSWYGSNQFGAQGKIQITASFTIQ